MGNGQLKPAYNVQIATENQFITNYYLFARPGDTTTLIPFLDNSKQKYGFQSEKVVADAGYGSEQNYDYLEENNIDDFVKFPYFHKEQKRAFKNNPYYKDNLHYNKDGDFFICTMGQRMTKISTTKTKTDSGYESKVSTYKAIRCEGCPMRSSCSKGESERTVSINHNLEKHRDRSRTNLKSFEGLYHRSKRPIEPEAVFGQIKFNKQFNRFLTKGLKGTTIEFGLVAIAHNLAKMIKYKKIA